MKWLLLSWRNVWRHTRRSLMAVSVIVVGVMAILTAIGFMLASFHGLQESTIRGSLGHIQVSSAEVVIEPDRLVDLEQDLARKPGVRFTMRRLLFEGLISNGPTTIAVAGRGIQPVKESRLSVGFAPLTSGEGLLVSGEEPAFSVLLADGVAAKLGARANDNITLLGTTISGVLNAVDVRVTGTFTTGIPEMDDHLVLVDFPTAEVLLDTRGVSRLVVVLKETNDTENTAAWLRESFPEFTIETWRDLASFYGQVVTLYRNIFLVLGAIILLVVSLSVTNTMVLAIGERIREMGTMMAMGIRRGTIRTNFAVEGAIMGLVGGTAGLLLAAIMAMVINIVGIEMPPPPGRSMAYPLVIFVDATVYAVTLLLMVISGALAAWLPTSRLSRLQIVDALREG